MSSKRHIAVYSAVFADPFIVTSFNPLVPILKTEFNVSIQLVALAVTFHMVCLALVSLFSGTLSDIYGRPRIIMYGLFLSAAGSIICALSPNIVVFLVARSMQGAGDGFFMAVGLALIGDITEKKDLGKAMGLYGAAVMSGSCLGPLLSGFISALGWRLIPIILFIYTLTAGVLTRVIFGAQAKPKEAGSSTLIFKQFKQVGTNRNIALISLSGLVSFFVYGGIQSLISDRLSQSPFSATSSQIGILFSVSALVGVLFSFTAGYLLDKFEDRKILVIGWIISLLVESSLIFTNVYWQYLILLPTLSAFNRFVQISLQAMAIKAMPESKGVASSIYSFAGYGGFAAAPAIMAPVYIAEGIGTVYSINLALIVVCVFSVFFIRIKKMETVK